MMHLPCVSTADVANTLPSPAGFADAALLGQTEAVLAEVVAQASGETARTGRLSGALQQFVSNNPPPFLAVLLSLGEAHRGAGFS